MKMVLNGLIVVPLNKSFKTEAQADLVCCFSPCRGLHLTDNLQVSHKSPNVTPERVFRLLNTLQTK